MTRIKTMLRQLWSKQWNIKAKDEAHEHYEVTTLFFARNASDFRMILFFLISVHLILSVFLFNFHPI